jgi:hypothetical protein
MFGVAKEPQVAHEKGDDGPAQPNDKIDVDDGYGAYTTVPSTSTHQDADAFCDIPLAAEGWDELTKGKLSADEGRPGHLHLVISYLGTLSTKSIKVNSEEFSIIIIHLHISNFQV